VAIAGASGYVGALLTERLAAAGHEVVAFARHPDGLPTGEGIEAMALDVGDVESTSEALRGVEAAYYLVHAMASGEGFEARDRQLARAFAQAAHRARVGRIIYLGGLGHEDLSAHLVSRQEVGALLAASGVPVVELRAAVILGAGSISFEMLRSLTERLPVMVCPRWITTRLQPLAERDLLGYLEESLTVPAGIYEIGAPNVTTYGEMMRCYAQTRGLRRRRILTVPFVTPSLSARWVDLFSPVDRRISHALIESLVNEVVVRRPEATAAAFGVRPMPVAAAIRCAIDDEAERVSAGLFERPGGLGSAVYSMRCEVALDPELAKAVSANLEEAGGDLSWYGAAAAWRLRLLIGRLVGERLDLHRPERIEVGASVDWWKVTRVDEAHLELASTSFLCGDSWLGYRIGSSPSRLEQIAVFRPKGVAGLAYWGALWPVHWVIFRVMERARIAAPERPEEPGSA